MHLPQYDPNLPWLELCGRALTTEQADRIRHTKAITTPYSEHEREMLARACAQIGEPHFLVTEAYRTVCVWRKTNSEEEAAA